MATKTPNIDGIIEAAWKISRKRHELLAKLRDALEANDQAKVNQFARELVGLTNEKKSDRTN